MRASLKAKKQSSFTAPPEARTDLTDRPTQTSCLSRSDTPTNHGQSFPLSTRLRALIFRGVSAGQISISTRRQGSRR
jgi:hypothetical protein